MAEASHDEANGTLSPLLRPGWHYLEPLSLEEFSAEDWALLDAQREPYDRERQAAEVLRILRASRDDPTFGYQINNFRHCLQSATKAYRAGKDEEYVVAALLHDIGFVVAETTHAAFAAALLEPYISADNHFMLAQHMVFQAVHFTHHPTADRHARERWRGHPAFERAAEFVALFDQDAVDPRYDNLPLEAFEPMVHRLFLRTPRVNTPPSAAGPHVAAP